MEKTIPPYIKHETKSELLALCQEILTKKSARAQIYDAETNNWTLGKPLPTPVYNAAGGATTGKSAPKRVYILGGCTSNVGPEFYNGTSMNQVYDMETDSWTVGAQMPTPRKRLAVAVVNDTLYAMGGVTGSTTLATVEQYTPVGYIPEFSAWLILPLFAAATVFAVAIKKKTWRKHCYSNKIQN